MAERELEQIRKYMKKVNPISSHFSFIILFFFTVLYLKINTPKLFRKPMKSHKELQKTEIPWS